MLVAIEAFFVYIKRMATGEHSGGMAAGLTGGVVFIIVFFTGSIWVAVPAALAAFILAWVIFSPRRRKVNFDVEGVSPEMYRSALREGAEHVKTLDGYLRRLGPGPVRTEVQGIRDEAAKILEEMERDPADVKTGRFFLSYYFETTTKILGKYLELSEHKPASPEVRAALEKVEDSLSVIRGAFAKQHTMMLANDIMSLDAEIEAMKKSIKMEGLE